MRVFERRLNIFFAQTTQITLIFTTDLFSKNAKARNFWHPNGCLGF